MKTQQVNALAESPWETSRNSFSLVEPGPAHQFRDINSGIPAGQRTQTEPAPKQDSGTKNTGPVFCSPDLEPEPDLNQIELGPISKRGAARHCWKRLKNGPMPA